MKNTKEQPLAEGEGIVNWDSSRGLVLLTIPGCVNGRLLPVTTECTPRIARMLAGYLIAAAESVTS